MNPILDNVPASDHCFEMRMTGDISASSEDLPAIIPNHDNSLANRGKNTKIRLLLEFLQIPRVYRTLLLCISIVNFIVACGLILSMLLNNSFEMKITEFARLIAWLIHEITPVILLTVLHIIDHPCVRIADRTIKSSKQSDSIRADSSHPVDMALSETGCLYDTVDIWKLRWVIISWESVSFIPFVAYGGLFYYYPILLERMGGNEAAAAVSTAIYCLIWLVSHGSVHLLILDLCCGLNGCKEYAYTTLAGKLRELKKLFKHHVLFSMMENRGIFPAVPVLCSS